MTNNLASVHQEASETSPGADATASPITGWIVSTGNINYSPLNSQVEQAASSFVATPVHPDGTIDITNGDCIRTLNTYNGDFVAGTWTASITAIAVTNGGAQDGLMAVRLHRSANADGSGATQLTAARVAGSAITDLTTTIAQTSTATFNPGAFTVTNEYLFLELGCERTGAGGMTSADMDLRIGNNSTRLVSTDFTPAAPPAGPPVGSLALMGVGRWIRPKLRMPRFKPRIVT